MTKIRFKKGSTVRLTSGGPSMTVVRNVNSERVECMWFHVEGYSSDNRPIWGKCNNVEFDVDCLSEAPEDYPS